MDVLSLTSPHWGVALTAVCFALAYGAARLIPFYGREAARLMTSRIGRLDGLRGFLAFGVVVTHMLSFHGWYAYHHWDWPPSKLYTFCGDAAVALFFMITGFLFWKRAIDGGGKMGWRALYVSRLRRLAPLYIFSVGILFIYVGMRTDWTLRVDLPQLLLDAGSWLGLGIFGRPDLNGMKDTWVTNTAIWTLRHEWLFYISLPIIASFARLKLFAIIALAILAIGVLIPGAGVAKNFVFGMAAAHIITRWPRIPFLATRQAALLSLAGFVLIAVRGFQYFGITEAVLLFPFFVCVVYGNSFFGLLSNLGARTMGLISYSIYLMHCLLLDGVLYALDDRVNIAQLAAWQYWVLMFALGLVLVVIALCTFRWIEYPFLRRSQRHLRVDKTVPPGVRMAG
jgi:peptidoglycan/LPS O-acetylase OafA/YrhL